MNENGFDLNLMLAFEALIKERSVSRAALRLKIGQPAMSNALARLREACQDALFIRTGREMIPTARALALSEPIERALSSIREALTPMAPFDPARSSGRFVISGGDYASAVLLPPLMSKLRLEAPRVDLRFRFVEKNYVFDLLDSGAVDLSLGVFPDLPKRFDARAVFQEDFVYVAGRGRRAGARPLSTEAFARLPHVLVTERGDESGVIDAALAQQGHERRIVLTVPSVFIVRQVLLATDLVATTGRRLAHLISADRELVLRELPFSVPPWSMSLICLRRRLAEPALHWLSSAILATGAACER